MRLDEELNLNLPESTFTKINYPKLLIAAKPIASIKKFQA